MDINVHHLYVHVNFLIVADFGNSINTKKGAGLGDRDIQFFSLLLSEIRGFTGDGDVHKYINNYSRHLVKIPVDTRGQIWEPIFTYRQIFSSPLRYINY